MLLMQRVCLVVNVNEYNDNIIKACPLGACSNTKHLVLLLQSCTAIKLASQGGDLRQALQSSEGKQQLHWYKKGSAIALDIIKGLHLLHSHSVSLAIHICSLQNTLARYLAEATALRRSRLQMTK